ncbi:catabolite control protein A [Synergistales bacterium]|nr:catabolite control protein A [Synergistales bacterium]
MKIKDIATLSGTSVATVSRVMNDDPRVRPVTRQKVLEVITSTGYKPNYMGRNLRKLKSNVILALVPTLANQIYARLLHGVEEKAMEYGYELVITVTHRKSEIEKKQLDMLYTKEADGAITFMSFLDDEYLEATAQKFPLVLCSGTSQCDSLSYTCINNEEAAYDATRHLLKLGHRFIARLNSTFSPIYEEERKKGFRRAMEEAGLQIDSCYLFNDGYSYHDGYAYTQKLMELPAPPTAILAFSDTIAAGCIKYLVDHGIRPGIDVDVMGFDNIDLGEIITPSLSTISMPLHELGEIAFDLLRDKMENIHSMRKGIIVDHKLVLRDSTRKLGDPV